MTLKCKKCSLIKPLSAYDGTNLVCRMCRSEICRQRYHANKGPIQSRVCPVIAGKRQCPVCKKFKELTVDNFDRQSKDPTAFMNKCKLCGTSPHTLKLKKHRVWQGKLF